MTGMSMAMFVVVIGLFCHLYNQHKAQTPSAQTRGKSSIISFANQTCPLGHSTTSTDFFPAQSMWQTAAFTHAASRVLWLPSTDILSWV